MADCVFCKIISGEYSSYKLYEDDYTLAFMDIAKDVDGHILVVPKKHVKNILDCDEETLSHVMASVKKISKHLVESCGFEGVNILSSNNECAEQEVPHLHIHIIPRKSNDGLKIWPSLPGAKLSIEEMFAKLK